MSAVITVNQLSMLYGARLLYDDVNLNLIAGNRYGLVGANGTGKSTFLRILTGDEIPSEGDVQVSKKLQIGWLKQDQFKYETDKIIDVVMQGNPELWQALQEKEALLLEETYDEKWGYRLSHLEEIIAHHQGYTAHIQIQKILVGLGIPETSHNNLLSTLSGGYKLRVLLAQVLFENPDILLLDEPTNHLDILSIAWLEHYLKTEFVGILVYISHDQEFLNNLSTHILDIDYGEIRLYVGNYDKYESEKKLIVEQKLVEKKQLEAKIAHMQSFVDRFKAKASKARQAQSRQKMIDKIELPDIKNSSRISPNFQFQQKRPTGKVVLKIDKIAKNFGEKHVLKDVKFTVHRGEKVVIIGQNGIGKSTLLKIILGDYEPSSGHYEWGHECSIAYFAQDYHDLLSENQTLLNWLTDNALDSEENIRAALGKVLFKKDDVQKSTLQISGGEAARLLFASIMLKKANILILDEPTNHLDIDARNALGEALKHFQGTVILVSHDRHFVSQLATRIIALTEEKITDFSGNYNEYLKIHGNDYLSKSWMAKN